ARFHEPRAVVDFAIDDPGPRLLSPRPQTAQRERLWGFWSGDIWRLIVLLKKYRPDLSIHTIATPPTGLAVVRNLDPSSRFIADNLGRLCAEFMALHYSYLEKDRAAKLNLFPNDWEQIRPLLARQL